LRGISDRDLTDTIASASKGKLESESEELGHVIERADHLMDVDEPDIGDFGVAVQRNDEADTSTRREDLALDREEQSPSEADRRAVGLPTARVKKKALQKKRKKGDEIDDLFSGLL
jgi:hypothetical protein